MSFTSINDPAGVKALLDQLRVSQAWQNIVVPPTTEEEASPGNSDEQPVSITPGAVAAPPTSSVASLLSQLQSSSSWPAAPNTSNKRDLGHSTTPLPVSKEATPSVAITSAPTLREAQNLRSYTFQQTLSHIAQLADDPGFVAAITQLKKEQDDLERQLWEDRCNIRKKYEEKVKVAITKANMVGDPGLSKHEADMLQTGLKKDLEKFDRDRVLIAWDGLISKQQAALAQHRVPAMFPTPEAKDRQRQQRVIPILEGIL